MNVGVARVGNGWCGRIWFSPGAFPRAFHVNTYLVPIYTSFQYIVHFGSEENSETTIIDNGYVFSHLRTISAAIFYH